MRQFRLLRPDEIECRVQQVKQDGVILLLYKTARTDAALLDETVGSMNWCNDYKVIDGKMYCGIAIRDQETLQWVWKWNCGTESNMESEKGQASDALKRAGFVWGIGTELYSSPFIYVPSSKCNIRNGKCYDDFEVTSIGYDKAENINSLVISLKGQPVWNMGTAVKIDRPATVGATDLMDKNAKTEKVSNKEEDLPFIFHEEQGGMPDVFGGKLKCSVCDAEISQKVADFSKSKYGKYLCMKCQPNKRR